MRNTKRRGRILTTAAEMREAARVAREREKTATKIRAAHYDPVRDAVVTELSTGVTLAVPRRAIAGFARAAPDALSDIEINPAAESLWSDTVDDGVLLEQLIEIAAGEELLKVLGGRVSGRRRSPAKAAAARANGAKGGRPPLTMGEFIRELERRLHELSPSAPKADVSGEPNPNLPAGAVWRIGGLTVLNVGIHGHNEVLITRTPWPRKRPIERRIRATALRVAGELARWLVKNKETCAVTTLAVHRATRHSRSRGGRVV
jgi:hypothetical protein